MVKINDTYYIDANSMSYILKEKVVISDKDSKNYGETIYKDVGYYGSVENLLNSLLKKETRKFISKETEHTLHELIDEVRNYQKYLESLNLKA